MKTFGLSLAIGTAITLVLFGLGYLTSEAGAETLSYVLYWQAYVAQKVLPCVPFRGEFLCESETAAMVAFFSGLPIGILIYSTAVYLLLRRRAASPAASHAPDDLR